MDLLRRRNLMSGGDAPVFVDYITLEGESYIDTGIIATEKTTFRIRLRYNNNSAQSSDNVGFFSRETDINTHVVGIYSRNTGKYGWGYNTTYHVFNYSHAWAFHSYEATIQNNKWTFSIDNGGHTESYALGSAWRAQKSICIGAALNGTTYVTGAGKNISIGKEACSFGNNNVVEADFRPCYYQGQYGLWDTLEGKFHGNASGQGIITGGYYE